MDVVSQTTSTVIEVPQELNCGDQANLISNAIVKVMNDIADKVVDYLWEPQISIVKIDGLSDYPSSGNKQRILVSITAFGKKKVK